MTASMTVRNDLYPDIHALIAEAIPPKERNEWHGCPSDFAAMFFTLAEAHVLVDQWLAKNADKVWLGNQRRILSTVQKNLAAAYHGIRTARMVEEGRWPAYSAGGDEE